MNGSTNLCGINSPELISSFDKTLTHSASTMTVFVTSNLDSNSYDESWGINNLFILIDYVIVISNDFMFLTIFKCSSNCLTCNGSGCLSCITTLFLYN